MSTPQPDLEQVDPEPVLPLLIATGLPMIEAPFVLQVLWLIAVTLAARLMVRGRPELLTRSNAESAE